MPREFVLGNCEILVNFDKHLIMRDFYYPYVGQVNHLSGYRCRVGVWTSDSGFAWIDDSWQINLQYKEGTVVTDSRASHRGLGIGLRFEQTVAQARNTLLQRITVENQGVRDREVRLFLAFDLRINESDIGDTAFYNPYLCAMVHYKRNMYFLIGGYVGEDGTPQTTGISQYACGIKEFGGAEGTWRDAEDGNLSGNAIAQGSVDSAVGFHFQLPPASKQVLRSWFAAGDSLSQVGAMQADILSSGFDMLLLESAVATSSWAGHGPASLDQLPAEVSRLYTRSLLVIRTHMDRRGAIIASSDSDIMLTARAHYAYTWPRDGALVSYALDRGGMTEVTTPFFKFCADALGESAVQNYWKRGAALMHKYGPDGTLGASWHPWVVSGGGKEPPIQEDGTALVVWSCAQHCRKNPKIEDSKQLYRRLVRPASDFLVDHRSKESKLPLPSWDIWEERRGIHLYTTAVTIAALDQASRAATAFGEPDRAKEYSLVACEIREAMLSQFWDSKEDRFVRMLSVDSDGALTKDYVVDSSAYALFAFGALAADHPGVVATMRAIGRRLWVRTEVGGLARYERDHYFRVTEDVERVPGNPWIICTLWLAEWIIETAQNTADLRPALDHLKWVCKQALPTGILPEQVNPLNSHPLSVAPLIWSHAQFVSTCLNYLDALEAFGRASKSASK